MKTSLILTVYISFLSLSAAPAVADTPTSCSLATMRGTYGFAGTGVRRGVPYSGSGFESYDGQGHLKYYELQSDGMTQNKYSGTGTYTITANCIATIIYDGITTEVWTYFVAPDGDVFFWNNNLGYGNVSGGREDRISRALLVQ
jgi:hypothetical protein